LRDGAHHLFAIGSPNAGEDIGPDPRPDTPIKQREARVHGLGDLETCRLDEAAYVSEQLRPDPRDLARWVSA
jgi:hypothetical protein